MTAFDDLYSEILCSGPSPGTLFLVISKLKQEGQLKRVIQECIKALDIYPFDIPIRQLLARSYFESGLLSQAEAELGRITTQVDEIIPLYKLQAEIFSRQGREEEAVEAMKLYLAHRPDDPEAIDFLERLKQVKEIPIIEPPPAVEEIPAPVEKPIEEEPETVEEKILPDIATPTLAEVCFKQGQIKEAIYIYEKVVAQNPEDENSRQRLEELKAAVLAETGVDAKEVDRAKEKKRKMIAILEAWLDNIREMSKAPVSA